MTDDLIAPYCEKDLFKVRNRGTVPTFMDLILVSSLFTLRRHSPPGNFQSINFSAMIITETLSLKNLIFHIHFTKLFALFPMIFSEGKGAIFCDVTFSITKINKNNNSVSKYSLTTFKYNYISSQLAFTCSK